MLYWADAEKDVLAATSDLYARATSEHAGPGVIDLEGEAQPRGSRQILSRNHRGGTMQVQNTTFKALIQGERQYKVPLYQRRYSWEDKHRRQLWRDVLAQYDRPDGLKAGVVVPAIATHFFGSFVLSPVPGPIADLNRFVVVDGQQRMTTLLIALCAIRDTLAASDSEARDRYNELYLVHKWQSAVEDHFRLVPTQGDRTAFFDCVEGKGESADGGIGDAYRFVRAQLTLPGPDGEPIDPERLANALLERLAIVAITTEPGDNPHQIFESLNATGLELTQADLLRNYLFMRMPTRGELVYQQTWQPLEQALLADGLTQRLAYRLEGLARVDLQRRGTVVATDEVYVAHQRRLDKEAATEDDVVAAVEDLAVRARHYRSLLFPDTEHDHELGALLARLRAWGAQTAYPVLMFGFDVRERGLCETEHLARMAALIESFLVRRQLAGVPTNALNRIFVSLIPLLPQDETIAEALHLELSRERRYWPTNEELRQAIATRPFYFTGRYEQRMLILRRLEESYEHPEPVDLQAAHLTIEHILPQSLSDDWREQLKALGQDPDEVHDELLHTLGNMTLTAFNGSLSNHPIKRKQQILQGSNLQLNKELLELQHWGREEILARSASLADRAVSLWPVPIPGVKSARSGFDWSLVNAACAAVGPGYWTSYWDLAQLAGTHQVPVGQHVARDPSVPNGHRVMKANGKNSSEFEWGDPARTDSPRDVLNAEGLTFFPDGTADPERRLGVEKLRALLDLDEEGDEEGATAEAA